MMLSVVVELVILPPLLLVLRFLKGLSSSVGVARAFVFAISCFFYALQLYTHAIYAIFTLQSLP